MTAPQRIQRRRTKGWRKPEGAIYVGRGSKWGNPWKVYRLMSGLYIVARNANEPSLGEFHTKADASREAVWRYRDVLGKLTSRGAYFQWVADFGLIYRLPGQERIRAELAGHDLMCWCDLDMPCHADVLLEIANGGAA